MLLITKNHYINETSEYIILDMLGTQPFVLCREVVLFRRLFCVAIEDNFQIVLCREVVLFRSALYQRFHCRCMYSYIGKNLTLQFRHSRQTLFV